MNLRNCNPIIGYFDINVLRNKIIKIREIYRKATIDLICNEAKPDSSIPDAQLHNESYRYPPDRGYKW